VIVENECPDWYAKTYSFVEGRHYICEPDQIFLHHMAHQLNATYDYSYPFDDPLQHQGQEPPFGVVAVDVFFWGDNSLSMIQPYLRDNNEMRFLYCRPGDERESFSFFFWAVPFDEWGWGFLALTLVVFTLVLKGGWLNVFGTLLLRQSFPSIDKKKPLVLLSFSAIVITCGYESIISSRLIIPPPLIVAHTLKDLVDSGYRIFGWDDTYADTSTLYLILNRENISYSSVNEAPFIPNTFMNYDGWQLYSHCNGTSLVDSFFELDSWQSQMDFSYPGTGIRCHFVKQTKYPQEYTITYSGYSLTTFHTFLTSYQESGILDMFYKLYKCIINLEPKIRVAQKNYAEKRTEIPFELKDPKIISIFIAWGILLVGGLLVFLTEYLWDLLINLIAIHLAISSLGK
jgi:hypothetical protein